MKHDPDAVSDLRLEQFRLLQMPFGGSSSPLVLNRFIHHIGRHSWISCRIESPAINFFGRIPASGHIKTLTALYYSRTFA